jgi:NAD(P)-dependent dehydrogenase (short-subunit alcohol dehydrogenase family)
MPNILIIGATRGLGASLANEYATQEDTTVYGTTRKSEAPTGGEHNEKIVWVKGIDVSEKEASSKLVEELGGLVKGVKEFDVVVSLVSFCRWQLGRRRKGYWGTG